jgi:peptidoglycan/LPS O-acetylase OafA/YrhL
MDSSGAPTFAHLAREIGLDSLLLGYREATLFAPLAQDLPPIARSLDAPFWSLHLELYGSLVVLGLVSLRARSVSAHRIAVAAAALTFGTHPMFLFVLGHLASPLPPSCQEPAPDLIQGSRRWRLGAPLLLLGLALSGVKNWQAIEWLRLLLSRTELANAPNLFQFQSQLAAVALFFGVLWCPRVWPVLQSGPCRQLGRLSFSIYLLHFPILFTLVCLAFITMPAPSVAGAFLLFLALTLVASIAFERLVDRPAIALGRRVANQRRNWFTSVSA